MVATADISARNTQLLFFLLACALRTTSAYVFSANVYMFCEHHRVQISMLLNAKAYAPLPDRRESESNPHTHTYTHESSRLRLNVRHGEHVIVTFDTVCLVRRFAPCKCLPCRKVASKRATSRPDIARDRHGENVARVLSRRRNKSRKVTREDGARQKRSKAKCNEFFSSSGSIVVARM